MLKTTNYRHTMIACYMGFITQAISNNLAPLLFLTFRREFGIPLTQLALISSINFGIQLLVDLVSARVVDRIGYRTCMVAAHVSSCLGLAGMAFFPMLLPDRFAGLLIAVFFYAVGGGLCEVLVSPIAEACPTEDKAAQMSLVHSFYCWGVVGVILLSTLFFAAFGVANWRALAALWAIVPFLNMLNFLVVPINSVTGDAKGMTIRQLFGTRIFWLLAVLMVCSGASELGLAQWASAFTESALGVSKAVGDLAGPCVFAVLMGCARTFYAKRADKVDLTVFMLMSSLLCVGCYLLASLASLPVFGLLGCGLCGLSVGIMWPGTFSIASAQLPQGGTAMFALLALAGDLGGTAGPSVIGQVAGLNGGNLKAGVLAGIAFPVTMVVGLFVLRRLYRRRQP
ncbi:MAG: MFS transporter [Clostridiales bacterium]|nr:MFS transporter [Clostridiales bacterium]